MKDSIHRWVPRHSLTNVDLAYSRVRLCDLDNTTAAPGVLWEWCRTRKMELVIAFLAMIATDRGAFASLDIPDVGPVVGIDLGTTYSCVSVHRNGRVEVIPNDLGNILTPSTVAFTSDGRRLVGDAAELQRASNPEGTISHVKRLIGRRWDEENVQTDIKHFPFKVVNVGKKPYIKVKVGSKMKTFSPEQISAMVLSHLKRVAERYLGENVTHAVVTVPASFTDAQRQSTKDAGMIAGLTILRIINEPTAAALSCDLDLKDDVRTVLVYDLGGGTLDVSLVTLGYGMTEVLATRGDSHIGGEDFTNELLDHFVKEFKKKHHKDLRQNAKALGRLRRECERAKRQLSSSLTANIKIESLLHGLDFTQTITRAQFERLNSKLFRATLTVVSKILKDAEIHSSEVDDIILVGGSTKIPKIQQLLKDNFDIKVPLCSGSPDTAVARGAAVQAAILRGQENDRLLVDIIPRSLGVQTGTGEMSRLIRRHSVIPVSESRIYTTSEHNQRSVSIKVYEGESSLTKENKLLGKFDLDGLPPVPSGEPNIEVTFSVDANGILQVTAADHYLDNAITVTINRAGDQSLSFDELDKMILETEKLEQHDIPVRELEDAKAVFEELLYLLQTNLNGGLLLSALEQGDTEILREIVSEHLDWYEKNSNVTADELEKQKKRLMRTVRLSCFQAVLSMLKHRTLHEKDEL